MFWRLGALLVLLFVPGTIGLAKPSVVLITIDTLRDDRVGGPRSLTPALDTLATDGVRFSQAMAQVPITLPSHASILTGTYPLLHGVRDFGQVLTEDKETLAEILKAAGYRTAAFVSSFALDSRWGLDQGFDLYRDDFDLSGYSGVGFNAVERRGEDTVNAVLKWLNEDQSAPFFLWVHLFDPHDPYDPPEPYRSQHPGRPYDGEVAYADAQAGRLLGALRKRGLYDSSLIVVMGDHGEGLGEHGEETHGFFVYNSTLHIPLIMKFPEGRYKGRKIEQVVRSIDMAPTVLQALQLPRGGAMQGQGLVSLLRDRPAALEAVAYSESLYARYHFGWSSLTCYSDGRYKYIRAPRRELYDLVNDPSETRNLYAESTSLGQQYDNLLDVLSRRFSAPGTVGESAVEVDAETRQRLQSLGYVALSAGKGGTGDDRDRADPKDKIEVFAAIRTATIESEKRNFKTSIRLLKEAIDKDPNIYTAHYLQGFNYFQTEQYLLAVEQFRAALQLYPDSPEAIHSLATSYLKAGLSEAAKLGYQRLLQVRPNDPAAHLGLGNVALKEKRTAEAKSEFESILGTGEEIQARIGLGRALILEDRLDEAKDQLETVLTKNPASADAHLLLGYVFEKQGKADLAREHLERSRRLSKP